MNIFGSMKSAFIAAFWNSLFSIQIDREKNNDFQKKDHQNAIKTLLEDLSEEWWLREVILSECKTKENRFLKFENGSKKKGLLSLAFSEIPLFCII